jgi:DNA-binding transcriptional MocR family regulator
MAGPVMSKPRQGRHGEPDKSARYVKLHHWMIQSPAWQSLDGNDRSVYVEIAAHYRGPGTNNGYIAYSVREAAKSLNIGKSTAARCLARLEERGFIVCMQKGVFKASRHATEWRLTEHACDRTGELATKTFMSWQSKNKKPVPVAGLNGTCGGTSRYL